MNTRLLSRALYDLSRRILDEKASRCDLKDAAEMCRVVDRVARGTPVAKALGAPGDWGYGTPIGDAIAAQPDPPTPVKSAPPFNENDCSGVFDGSRVVSDADPGL